MFGRASIEIQISIMLQPWIKPQIMLGNETPETIPKSTQSTPKSLIQIEWV